MNNKSHRRFAVLVFAFLFLCAAQAFAQKAPMRWGKPSDEELKMAVYEPDTAAAALILGDYGNIYFDLADGNLNYILEHHRRIKILKRSGFDYGDVAIGYRKDGEKISNFKAQTITPGGETHSVAKSDIFEEKVNDNWIRMKFTFPRLEEGAVLEYQYNLTSNHYLSLREWYFQREIPTLHSELRLSIPEWYDYIFLNQGRKFDISEREQKQESVRIPNIVRSEAFGSQQRGTEMIQTQVNRYRYVMNNVPAMREEAFVTTMDDYLARLRFQLRSVKYPSGPFHPILSDWSTVAKELMDHKQFGQQFTRNRTQRRIMEELAPALAGASTKEEKAVLAYSHLAKLMQWDERYSFLAGDDLEKCLELRKGSSGELNLLLLAALKALEVECYPVLVSTRHHGKALDLYPIINQFNHVAVIARIGDQFQLFELGNAARPPGIPRPGTLNDAGWLVNPDNPVWIELSAPLAKTARIIQASIDEQGTLSFDMQEKHEGYYAVNFREEILKDKKCAFIQNQWQKRFPDTEVQAVAFEGDADPVEPVKISYKADVPGGAQAVGDFIYFNPILAPDFAENPFKLQERSYPVDITFPFEVQNIYFIDIPEGYVVEELPESVRISLPDEGGKLEYMTSTMGPNKIRVIQKINLRQLHFEPEEYPNIKNFFDILLQKQGEQIVLKKQM
jgi:hypothetical protein